MRKAVYRSTAGAVALTAIVLLAGCLTGGKYVARTDYILRPQPKVEKAESSHKALGVRPLSPAVNVQSEIAYRKEDYQLHYYESVRWAEPPREAVTRTLKDALVATGHFTDVGDARDMQPNLLLTGELREFEELYASDGHFAVVTVRLELRTTADDAAVWSGTLTSRIKVEGDGLNALAAAMSRAIADIAEQAAAGIVKST